MLQKALALGLSLSLLGLSQPLYAAEAPAAESPAPAITQRDYGQQKVVYHINYNDEKHVLGALRNIQNHINAVGADNLDLKVVLHGAGVDLLIKANEDMDFQSKVINLKTQNVKFAVCNNTLVGRKLDYGLDLFDVQAEDIVPSGVAELSYLQQQGYTYIKP